jgi:hypothetical protein
VIPHPIFTLFAAVLLAAAWAMVGERSTHERLCAAARLLFNCAMVVTGGAWLMRLIHG